MSTATGEAESPGKKWDANAVRNMNSHLAMFRRHLTDTDVSANANKLNVMRDAAMDSR